MLSERTTSALESIYSCILVQITYHTYSCILVQITAIETVTSTLLNIPVIKSTSQQQVREVRAKLQQTEKQNEELHAELEAAQRLAKDRERKCQQLTEESKKLSGVEKQNEELYAELEAAQHLARERERTCQQLTEECKKLSFECSSQVSQIVS